MQEPIALISFKLREACHEFKFLSFLIKLIDTFQPPHSAWVSQLKVI